MIVDNICGVVKMVKQFAVVGKTLSNFKVSCCLLCYFWKPIHCDKCFGNIRSLLQNYVGTSKIYHSIKDWCEYYVNRGGANTNIPYPYSRVL